jgi:hypothetical protein
MRIQIITMASLLVLVAAGSLARPQFATAGNIRELNTDIHNNEGDLRKNEWDAAHDQRDINRDDSLRNADLQREQRDARDGDASGANYWRRQAKDQNAEIAHDQRDLEHSRHDIHDDKIRLGKDFKARQNMGGKFNKSTKKR